VLRAWYDSTSETSKAQAGNQQESPQKYKSGGGGGKYPPNVRAAEPGAVVCRVSKSFIRFAQLELFGLRGETERLVELADYLCFREYPELLGDAVAAPTTAYEAVGPPERYVCVGGWRKSR
jgi:hypothetical protein